MGRDYFLPAPLLPMLPGTLPAGRPRHIFVLQALRQVDALHFTRRGVGDALRRRAHHHPRAQGV